MFDLVSFLLGKKAGTKDVVLSDDTHYEYKDTNSDGNIEITEKEGGET